MSLLRYILSVYAHRWIPVAIAYILANNVALSYSGPDPSCVSIEDRLILLNLNYSSVDYANDLSNVNFLIENGYHFDSDDVYIYRPNPLLSNRMQSSTIVIPQFPCNEICVGYAITGNSKKRKITSFRYINNAIYDPTLSKERRASAANIFLAANGAGLVAIFDRLKPIFSRRADGSKETTWLPTESIVRGITAEEAASSNVKARFRSCLVGRSDGLTGYGSRTLRR